MVHVAAVLLWAAVAERGKPFDVSEVGGDVGVVAEGLLPCRFGKREYEADLSDAVACVYASVMLPIELEASETKRMRSLPPCGRR